MIHAPATSLQLQRTKLGSIRRQRRGLRISRTTKISTTIASSKNTGLQNQSNILNLHSESKKRLKELREAAKVRRYGSVTPISSSDFVREVTQASAEDWVVVCLYKDGLVCDLCNVKMEGYEEFEERRKKKFDKQIDLNVMISSKGLDNLCRGGSVSVGDTEVRFFADEWSEVHQLIPLVKDGETDKKGGYDIILMAETLYSISAQKSLYELIKRCLAYHDGAVYMAAKKYYFGVGGGTRQFLSMIEKDGKNGLYKERIVFVHPQHHP